MTGRAWSGYSGIARVEFGADARWTDAATEPPRGPFAWSPWTATWNATPGEHVLSCRATDAVGNSQPTEPPWNYQGMGNNLIQQVEVLVR